MWHLISNRYFLRLHLPSLRRVSTLSLFLFVDVNFILLLIRGSNVLHAWPVFLALACTVFCWCALKSLLMLLWCALKPCWRYCDVRSNLCSVYCGVRADIGERGESLPRRLHAADGRASPRDRVQLRCRHGPLSAQPHSRRESSLFIDLTKRLISIRPSAMKAYLVLKLSWP